ncbi:hypothetical protein EIP86_001398 [Pleurotus ostreatoroseus]|nr:hypothetical protein EIP86_001398 [Pleurotus ostreatoroseus]
MVNERGSNGYKPSPPDAVIRPFIEDLVRRNFKNHEIVKKLYGSGLFDPREYSVSVPLLKKKRSQWKLYSARGQAHTVHSAGPSIERMREKYPRMGAHKMKQSLLKQEGINVPKKLILKYMNEHHPEELRARRAHRLTRKQFWCLGVNDLWCMDQHDKWRKFELDPGTENNNIANAQTVLRHRQDPTLADTLQHKFMGGKRNVKPEISWGLMRKSWAPGFEELLDKGVNEGIYDPDDILERFVFHYIFIPWLQKELDMYVEESNDNASRRDRHKALPHGRPIEIYNHPEQYNNSLDFAIIDIDQRDIDEVRAQYAPPDSPCFELVPPRFAERAVAFHTEKYGPQGPPAVNRENAWDLYSELLAYFRSIETEDADLGTEIAACAARPPVGEDPNDVTEVLNLARPRGRQRVIGGEARIIDGKHRNVGGRLVFEEGDSSDEEGEVALVEFEWSDDDHPGESDEDEE